MQDIWGIEKQRSYIEQARIILKSCGDANKQLAQKLDDSIQEIFRKLMIL